MLRGVENDIFKESKTRKVIYSAIESQGKHEILSYREWGRGLEESGE